jgi:hypothetical protein
VRTARSPLTTSTKIERSEPPARGRNGGDLPRYLPERVHRHPDIDRARLHASSSGSYQKSHRTEGYRSTLRRVRNLFLTKADLDKSGFEGAKCVCAPPPRESEADCKEIWKSLENGTFTILSSDHCPFRYGDSETGKKSVISDTHPEGHFKYIPNGLPGIETRLPLTFSAGRLPPMKFVEVTSTNPANLYGLYPTRGRLLRAKVTRMS